LFVSLFPRRPAVADPEGPGDGPPHHADERVALSFESAVGLRIVVFGGMLIACLLAALAMGTTRAAGSRWAARKILHFPVMRASACGWKTCSPPKPGTV
jgi:hypothetical protein